MQVLGVVPLIITTISSEAIATAATPGFTLLHTFTGGTGGQNPRTPMLLANDGNLYGSALGGKFGFGLIYRIDQAGQFSIVHQFAGGVDDAGNALSAQPVEYIAAGHKESGSTGRHGMAHPGTS